MEEIQQLINNAWAERSPEIDKLAAALSKAQGKIEAAVKDSANPFFKSKYADLASVWAAIRQPLTENGLSIVQEPSSKNGLVAVTTTLLHSSGQYTRSTLEVPVGKQDAQGYGSAITYVRRYQLQAIAGVAPEDDDGNAASNGQQKTQVPPVKTKTPEVKPARWTGEDIIKGGEHDGVKWRDVPADWLESKRYGTNKAATALIEAEISRRDEEAFDREHNNHTGGY
jgi:hypothetical protein